MVIREYSSRDLPEIIRIWNGVVDEGIAFPQEDMLDLGNGSTFFASQGYTGFHGTIIHNEGLWQRLNMAFMYLPLIVISVKRLM